MSEAPRIRVLPIQTANKIAAGEVVDRPASVVKELMENALDAGAGQIDVAVTAGGRKLIRVSDDGHGMGREDALLAVERHATSKISAVDDIERIATLGFRGEALAAIASVSRFLLETCARGEPVGTALAINGGQRQDVQETGCPHGTCISVRDLFFNVPARRKFLRTQQTELFHIRDTFIVQALAHPETGMSLTVDGRETYRLPQGDDLASRIRLLFGPDLLRRMVAVAGTGADAVAVTGLVSLPSASRTDRNEQYVFVNGRPVAAALLSYAIHQGYAGSLAKGRHPSVFLFLEMPPEHVDVNVHPTKKEVRFRHAGRVRDAVIAALQQALAGKHAATAGAAPPFEDLSRFPGTPAPAAAAQQPLHIPDLPPARAFQIPHMPPDQQRERPPGGSPPPPAPETASSGAGSQAPWKWCRVVGQVCGRYVVLETGDGMVMMDPRAAHERVLYEQFSAALHDGSVPTQPLLIPETVELTRRDAQRLRRHAALLTEMGFGLSEFGADSYVVDALPACLAATAATRLIESILEALDEAGGRGDRAWWQEQLARGVCRAAVAHDQVLSLQELEQLVVDLARCEMPYTSPSGRPTLILTSLQELNRKFGRT